MKDSEAESFREMEEKLKLVITSLPPNQQQIFDASLATPAFMSWNSFWLKQKDAEIHVAWNLWMSGLTKHKLSDFEMFIDLFQNVQIRSMSEAIAESVGSMMVSHGANGRSLQPLNFSLELYLRFNLGPLHLLNNLIQDIIQERQKDYLRKCDASGRLDKLVATESATIFNHRKKESSKARLPIDLW